MTIPVLVSHQAVSPTFYNKIAPMVEVTAECYCKSDEKLLKVISYQKCKILNYNIAVSVTQPSAAVQAQQIPMVTKRLSLTENICTKSTDFKG